MPHPPATGKSKKAAAQARKPPTPRTPPPPLDSSNALPVNRREASATTPQEQPVMEEEGGDMGDEAVSPIEGDAQEHKGHQALNGEEALVPEHASSKDTSFPQTVSPSPCPVVNEADGISAKGGTANRRGKRPRAPTPVSSSTSRAGAKGRQRRGATAEGQEQEQDKKRGTAGEDSSLPREGATEDAGPLPPPQQQQLQGGERKRAKVEAGGEATDGTESTASPTTVPAAVSQQKGPPSAVGKAQMSEKGPSSATSSSTTANTVAAATTTTTTTTTTAVPKVVFNIAGVSIPAYLAEAADPPPLFSRANKTRRNRRRKHMTTECPVFHQHQGLRDDAQMRSRYFHAAPLATEEDVVRSRVEFTDSPALVYAALLWKYTPEAILSMAMLRSHRNASEASGVVNRKHDDVKREDEPELE